MWLHEIIRLQRGVVKNQINARSPRINVNKTQMKIAELFGFANQRNKMCNSFSRKTNVVCGSYFYNFTPRAKIGKGKCINILRAYIVLEPSDTERE